MPAGDVETYHSDGKWRNRIEALGDLPGEHDRKEDAVREGADHARERKVEHIIRRLDGTIGERNSYGNDPATSRDESQDESWTRPAPPRHQ